MRAKLLLGSFALLLPSAAVAQDAAVNAPAPPAAAREQVSIVAINAGRLGLLIPLSEHWMVRPDFAANASHSGAPRTDVVWFGGVSLIRRSAPTANGWTYLSVRYGVRSVRTQYDPYTLYSDALTVTAGAHGLINDWLAAFGEVGPAFSYAAESNAGAGDVTTDGSLVTRIGVTIRMPRSGTDGSMPAPESSAAIPAEGERPSWVMGGFGAGGVLIPLSDRRLIRTDFGFSSEAQRSFYSRESAEVGVSLLQRFAPTQRGWVFGAARYAFGYTQANAQHPSWSHTASFTVGGHARLRDRLGLMAEAGIAVRYAEQRTSGAKNTLRSGYMVRRVGLTYRWKDRQP